MYLIFLTLFEKSEEVQNEMGISIPYLLDGGNTKSRDLPFWEIDNKYCKKVLFKY